MVAYKRSNMSTSQILPALPIYVKKKKKIEYEICCILNNVNPQKGWITLMDMLHYMNLKMQAEMHLVP